MVWNYWEGSPQLPRTGSEITMGLEHIRYYQSVWQYSQDYWTFYKIYIIKLNKKLKAVILLHVVYIYCFWAQAGPGTLASWIRKNLRVPEQQIHSNLVHPKEKVRCRRKVSEASACSKPPNNICVWILCVLDLLRQHWSRVNSAWILANIILQKM